MLLSYVELVELVEQGVIDAPMENINGASIDLTLNDGILVERYQLTDPVIKLHEKQTPDMIAMELTNEGFYLRPGQFILASTRETFNLPNNIAAEFKLKSSIARGGLNHLLAGWCFTGDTKIPLIDGTSVCISDIENMDDVYVYSLNKSGEIVPGKVVCSGVSGYVDDTVIVKLDNGESFECTPDHSVMLRNGKYVEAEMLNPGDSLMPLYRRDTKYGHEEVYCPSLLKKSNWNNPKGKWRPTHKIVFNAIYGGIDDGLVVHHLDHSKKNNHPSNLCKMDAKEHLVHHSLEMVRLPERRATSSKNGKELFNSLWKDADFAKRKKAEASITASRNNAERWSVEENHRIASETAKQKNFVKSLRKYQEENPGISRFNAVSGKFRSNICKMIQDGLDINPESYIANKGQSAPSIKTLEDVYGSFDNALSSVGYMNHRVVFVKRNKHSTAIPVYDITVEGYHNFAIEPGVFVHNCDPGWHGSKLTLELKNNLQFHTLHIVPGMKIGQMIFYRVTPVPDESSYAVKGRYNQTTTTTASKGV
jgi:deoxycytidine triphosphate deaminase